MVVRVRYKSEQRPISVEYGDIYLCGDEYRIGDPVTGSPIHAETKKGKILAYLLEHTSEHVSYDTLEEVSGSDNIHSLMTGLRCWMRQSTSFRFGPWGRGPVSRNCVTLEKIVKAPPLHYRT